MEVYFILVAFLIIAFLYFKIEKEKYKRKKYIQKDINAINTRETTLYFFCIFLLLAFRHQSMGYDLDYRSSTGYLGWFETFANADLSMMPILALSSGYDLGFVLFNKLLGFFTTERQLFLASCAAISILPYIPFVKKYSPSPFVSVAIFIGLPTFLYLYGTLRQMMAVGILLYSIDYIVNRKFKKFVFVVIIAFFFHASCIIFLLAYPLYHMKITGLGRVCTFIVIALVYVTRAILLPHILPYITVGEYSIDNTSSSKSFYVFIFIYVVCCLLSQKYHCNSKEGLQINGFLNLFFMSCVCMAFQDITPVAARMSAFFMFSLVVLVPIIISTIRSNRWRAVISLFFVLFFLGYGLIRIDAGGEEYAMSSPYYWFWETI